jgi:cation diffusion facilitator CzcD-associated flavoprotein CzcO
VSPVELDALIVGAGFSGLYALHLLRGAGLSVKALERGDGVGGTWYWNRYPGARCDTPSFDYSYSFCPELQDEWDWTERYATQPEILRYLEHVADRFDLRRDVELGHEVISASFDASSARWDVWTGAGGHYRPRFCVMATGCLSSVNLPPLDGLERFSGRIFHTARWPQDGVDFSDRIVGFIGTGSTGIQAIPQIARQAAQLVVFQRTANFSLPAQNHAINDAMRRAVRATYADRRRRARESRFGVPFDAPTRAALDASETEREAVYERSWRAGADALLWASFSDTITDLESNATAADFVRAKIRGAVVDPAVAHALSPTSHPIGTKRICIDIGYYETFNRSNVRLVDLKASPIDVVTPSGVRTASEELACDDLVFATGFDAITGSLLAIDIRGRDGIRLGDAWAEGPRSYLGLAVPGFPNMFMVTGPGSPSVLSNMVHSIEQHVEWIGACIAAMTKRGYDWIEASVEAQDAWLEEVNRVADATLFPLADSWYVGANIPGKPRAFMPYVGGVGVYRRICEEVVDDGYAGFVMSASRSDVPEGPSLEDFMRAQREVEAHAVSGGLDRAPE